MEPGLARGAAPRPALVDDDPDSCTILCESRIAGAEQECASASTGVTLCFASLGCEDLAQALSGGTDHACGFDQIQRDTVCNGGQVDCDFGADGDLEGTNCELEIFCPGDPVQKMTCDAGQCLCLVDDEQVGSCPSDTTCGTLAEISDKGVSCCGFTPVGP